MAGGVDPYAVLGVPPGADQAAIHAAYRVAVRRTHPDAGGTAAAFEEVQEAYETLRDGPRRTTPRATRARQQREPADNARGTGAGEGSAGGGRGSDARRGATGSTTAGTAGDADRRAASSRMETLLAESRRLEDEARRLAGLPPRHDLGAPEAGTGETADSATAILRDARDQLRAAADVGARELRRRIRRML